MVLAVGLGLAARGLRPPEARPVTVAAEEFSAERALPVVEALATAPRHRPSPHHAAARADLAHSLRALGLDPVEQEAVVDGHPVTNLLARRAGLGAGAILLMAHYDSVAAGPGAGDDALGCAVILEIARALASDAPPPPRDLILLFTDGEEIALLGARAFVHGGDGGAPPHAWASEVALVLNFEARGSGGPAWMFQTGPGNLELVRALARAPRPAASSLAKAVYDRMPNDTDLTIFLRAGIPGLNWACVDRFSSYHTALDVPSRLDPGTVQHMGDQGLTVARWALAHPGHFDAGSDAQYFTILGTTFVHFPLGGAALLGLLPALLAALWLWRTRPRATALLTGLLASLLALAAAAAVVLIARALAPEFFGARASHASDLHLRAAGLALCAAAAAAALGVRALALRFRPATAPDAALLLLTALGAAALGFLLPEGAFLLAVPAAAIAAALLPRRELPAAILRAAAILLTASLAGTWIYSLLLALTLEGALAPALLAAVNALLLAPLWRSLPPRHAPPQAAAAPTP